MASLQTHRKLLPASNSTNPTVQTCLYFCNSQTQTQNNNSSPNSGFCPEVCLAICPSQCHYSLSLPPNNNSPHHHHHNNNNNISPLLICMLVVLASVFLLIILYILYTKLYHHFYYTPQTRTRLGNGNHHPVDEDHGNRVVFHPYWYISTAGLPPTEIRSIPTLKYENNQMETQDCGVCLTEFEQGDELRVLPKCNHAFHLTCIDTWLSSHTTCPLCRTPIIPLPHHHDRDRDRDRDRDQKAEDTSSSLAPVEGVTEDNSPAAAPDDDEVLSISAIRGVDDDNDQEVENNLEEASTNEMMLNKNKSRFME